MCTSKERNEATATQASRTLITKYLSQSLEEDRHELNTCYKMLNSYQIQIDEAVKSNVLLKEVHSIKNSCSIYYYMMLMLIMIFACVHC